MQGKLSKRRLPMATKTKKKTDDTDEVDVQDRIVMQATYPEEETKSRYDGYVYYDPDNE